MDSRGLRFFSLAAFLPSFQYSFVMPFICTFGFDSGLFGASTPGGLFLSNADSRTNLSHSSTQIIQ